MKIDRIMKQYYAARLEEQAPPPEIGERLRARLAEGADMRRSPLRQSLAFNAAVIAVLGLMLWLNSGTALSLKEIDPDNTRIRRVEQTLHNGLEAIWAAAVSGTHPPE